MKKYISFRENFIPLILNGTKTQTRRVMKKQPIRVYDGKPFQPDFIFVEGETDIIRTDKTKDGKQILKPIRCEYGKVGDVIEIRDAETKLQIQEIRAERVSQISEFDAVAEGFVSDFDNAGFSAVNSFAEVFEDIYGEGSFDSDPFVWVITFSRC